MCCKIRSSLFANYFKNSLLIASFKCIQSKLKFIVRTFMKCFGPILFIIVNLLILSIVFVGFMNIIPSVKHKLIMPYIIYQLYGIWLTINIFFNYNTCVFTSPGTPNYSLENSLQILSGYRTDKLVVHEVYIATNVSYKYCQSCRLIKPPRSHHCSVYGKCVLEMDHFCPWMNNCIGYYNYRYFVLFLFYIAMGCIFIISLTFSNMLQYSETDRSIISLLIFFRANLYSNVFKEGFENLSIITYSFAITFSALISSGLLLTMHIYLIITNQTTIEYFVNLSRYYELKQLSGEAFVNPFDDGLRKNLRRVFGDCQWYVHLFPNFTPPGQPKFNNDLGLEQSERSISNTTALCMRNNYISTKTFRQLDNIL